MHSLTDIVITTERERQITDTATYMSPRQVLLNPPRRFDKVDGIVIMFFDTCSHRKHIRVEDDIVRIKAHLFGKNAISTSAHLNLALVSICLTLLIKSHDYGCRSQALYHSGTFYKNVLPFL